MINEKSKSRLVSAKSREKSAKSNTSEKSIHNKSNLSNRVGVNDNNLIKTDNSKIVDNQKKDFDLKILSPVQDKEEHNISCKSIKSISSVKNNKHEENLNNVITKTDNSNSDPFIDMPNIGPKITPITYKYTNEKKTKKDKNDEFPEIRVIKSYEDKDLRQNLEQFDIEYMCRCLGLALMKHIEGSKDKLHIIELINIQDKFDFYNSIFNMNFDFFNSFINLQNKISNLDKLDNYYKLNEKSGTGINSKELQFLNENSENNIKANPQISLYSHMNYTDDKEDATTLKMTNSNVNNNTKEIIDHIKFDLPKVNIIHPFKYKNVGDKAKNLLYQDLTAINEIDSMEFAKCNLLLTVDQKIKKQPTEYIDLLQESATNFLVENTHTIVDSNFNLE